MTTGTAVSTRRKTQPVPRIAFGRIKRRQRAVNLGRKADVPTAKLAERKLGEFLSEVNDTDARPRPVMTVREFVETCYRKLKLPTKKSTTQHGYNVVLERHILPELGDRQLADVTIEDAQAS